MFRKLTSTLYQITHQQVLATLGRNQNNNLKNTYKSLAQRYLNYDFSYKSNSNKKITIVGTQQTSLPMAKYCLDQEVCQQICIMDLQAMKENSKSDIKHNTNSPFIIATKYYQDTQNSDLIILTKDIKNRQEKPNTIKDTLEQYTNVMKNLIPNLVKYSPNTIFLIDTEQADLVAYVAWKLSHLPKNRVLSPREIKECENVKDHTELYTAEVAAKIIQNYQRILLSTLPQVSSYEDNSLKCSQIFSTSFLKLNKDFNECRKIII